MDEFEIRDGMLFEYKGQKPAYEYKSFHTEPEHVMIVVPDGVTEIRNYAFVETAITEITIPESVTRIGVCAFSNCEFLSFVKMPKELTYLGDGAFMSCTDLKSIEIPYGITRIMTDTFSNCSSLVSVKIPDSVTYIESFAFQNCADLKEITIPNGVTKIGHGAFAGCESLKTVRLPESLTTIGYNAFRKCRSLKNIVIPDSVTTIEDGAFEKCKSLTRIVIPKGITTISSDTFRGCSSLVSVVLHDGIKKISNGAFYGCAALKDLKIPETCQVGFYAFNDNDSLKDKNGFTVKNGILLYYDNRDPNVVIPDGVTEIHSDAFTDCEITAITIPDSVKKIGTSSYPAFRFNKSIKKICCPTKFFGQLISREGLVGYLSGEFEPEEKMIPSYKKYVRREIVNILPILIKKDNDPAMDRYLREVLKKPDVNEMQGLLSEAEKAGAVKTAAVIRRFIDERFDPAKLSKSGKSAKDPASTYWKKYFRFIDSDKGKYDGIRIIRYLGNETDVDIPAFINDRPVVSIAYTGGEYGSEDPVTGAFQDFDTVTSVIIPEGIKSISTKAFSDCSSLKRITIPSTVDYIGDHAFENCTSLESVVIPADVEFRFGREFKGCTALKTVNFSGPFDIDMLAYETFKDCTSLERIDIPDGVTMITERMFEGCSSLTTVTIPESVKDIRANAFRSCPSLKNIYVYGKDTGFDVYHGVFDKDNDELIIHAPKGSEAEEFALSQYRFELL